MAIDQVYDWSLGKYAEAKLEPYQHKLASAAVADKLEDVKPSIAKLEEWVSNQTYQPHHVAQWGTTNLEPDFATSVSYTLTSEPDGQHAVLTDSRGRKIGYVKLMDISLTYTPPPQYQWQTAPSTDVPVPTFPRPGPLPSTELFPKDLEVQVTDADIREGVPGQPVSCAFARAVKRRFDGEDVRVTGSGIFFGNGVIYQPTDPWRFGSWINAFDHGGSMSPMTMSFRRMA